jgi:hypothetical protein
MDHSPAHHTRRTFLTTGLTATALAAAPPPAQTSGAPSTLLDVDFRKLVSRADLVYDKPASRSEEGIPVGNGRTGSLVWTTPTELRFQVNRVDVYGNNSYTNSFNERNNDYCSGCGYVDIDFAGFGDDPFPASGFAQHLSVYDGLLTVNGKGVTSRILAWPVQDVMAVEVEDTRRSPEPVQVNLRMLRRDAKHFGQQLETFARDHIEVLQTRSHTAASQLLIRGNRIALTQEFREGDYCCKSAVAIGVAGRDCKPRLLNETEVCLAAAPGPGTFQVLIASAASFDPKEDVLAAALRQLEAAASFGFSALAQETEDWWHGFWSRGFLHLHSEDGVADFVERNYNYFLYVMAASSRGKFPPKFNGMIWNTGGDLRTWGAQHWFANLSCYYEALPAANRLELMDPMFDMYSGMLEACSTAARQEWGSQGMYIPETAYFDGLERLPDDIAAEMADLYLLRKPWEQRSERFREYSQHKHPHSSRWNWIAKGEWTNGRFVETERGNGPYGNVSHILGTTAKIAYLYWRRYEYTLDRDWLRARAYPMLKAAAEFYRNFPNLRKEADGKYHIHHVNSNESVYGARDTDEDLSAMRGVVAAVIRAAEILNQDAALRAAWKEFLANLTPLPTSDDPDALKPETYAGPRVWARGRKPAIKEGGLLPDGNSLPAWFFDLCNLESKDTQALETANNTLTQSFRSQPGPDTPVGLLSKIPIAAATLGRTEAVRFLIPNQLRGLPGPRAGVPPGAGRVTANLANRMSLREGFQALDAEALGRASEALHMALMQSNPPAPAEDPVIRLAPAWPKEWDADFSLRARGAFLVTSSIQHGQVAFVEVESQAGAPCRLRNPWGEGAVTLYRGGNKAESLQGSLLEFGTRQGENIVVVPANAGPAQFKRPVMA